MIEIDTTQFTPTERRFIQKILMQAKLPPPQLEMVVLFKNHTGFLIAASCSVRQTIEMLQMGRLSVDEILAHDKDPRKKLGDDLE